MADQGKRRGAGRGFLRDSPLIAAMWVLIALYVVWALLGGPLPF